MSKLTVTPTEAYQRWRELLDHARAIRGFNMNQGIVRVSDMKRNRAVVEAALRNLESIRQELDRLIARGQ